MITIATVQQPQGNMYLSVHANETIQQVQIAPHSTS